MSGYDPIVDDLILTRGADWAHRYNKAQSDTAFPTGTTAEIQVTKDDKPGSPVLATWPAESVTDNYIEFWVQSEDLDGVPARYRYRLMVHYPAVAPITDTFDFCWYRGTVRRKD
ncbi:hypothetical protein [Rhodococcus sp. B10]|uniref:LtfC-like domain-containing protein n=1 Tax=Rhodococcus sp. B10 TaxID=2695876 RepID=UPI0014313570|nr:hypothetical protein [Rhodococcus sp. B10]NIL77586.1 hypothetical protein [Rhodococcus sp. B10]